MTGERSEPGPAGAATRLRQHVTELRDDEPAAWRRLARDLDGLVPRPEAATLRREIRGLLSAIQTAHPRHRATSSPQTTPPPTTCTWCQLPWPHDQAAWSVHGRRLWWHHYLWSRTPVGKRGYYGGTDAARVVATAHRIARRTQAFIETAPHAAAVLGVEGVRAIAARYPSNLSYVDYRRWVALHYGGARTRYPRRLRPVDQLTWRRPVPWSERSEPRPAGARPPRPKPQASAMRHPTTHANATTGFHPTAQPGNWLRANPVRHARL